MKGGPKKTIEIFKCGFEGDFKINSCKLLPCRIRTIFFLLIRLFKVVVKRCRCPFAEGLPAEKKVKEEGEGKGEGG